MRTITASRGVEQQLQYIQECREKEYAYSKGINLLFDLALNYLDYCYEQAAQGKDVVWTPGFTEGPLIYACDAIPLAFTEAGRIGSPEVLSVADNHFQVPRETCPMIKVNIGEWYNRRNGPVRKILCCSADCEPFNVMVDIMRSEGYDVKFIDTAYRPPHISEKRLRELEDFYCREYHSVVQWISGKPLDKKNLEFELKRRNRISAKIRKFLRLRQDHPTYIKSFPTMYVVTSCLYFFGRPDKYEEMLDMLIEEMEGLKPGDFNDKVVYLVWSGSRSQEYGIYKAVDEAGGALMGWMCTMPFETDFEEDIDPVLSMVRYKLQGQAAGATILRCADVEAQVKKVKAKGIISYGYVGCSYSGIDRELQREYFKVRNIPTIILDGTYQVGPASGQVVTRVRAFIEMLS
jgi:benzoyl-CoA reductase/2-hydroxyglutaryl-CoA dehydratase subunit BcrC/BadD/HgdB